jgi:hypothetical protein
MSMMPPNPQGGVPIAPVPTVTSVAQGTGADGQPWVLLIFDTPLGRSVFHLTPDNAKLIGEGMVKLGTAGALTIVPRLNGGG